jgi:hypothetical protein
MNLLGLLAGSAVVQGFVSLPSFGGSARLSTSSLVKNGPVAFTSSEMRRLEELNLYGSSSSSYESEDFSDENHRSSSSGVSDLEELNQRISKQSMEDLFLAPDGSLMVKPEDVHIILFNPNTDEEGAHTIEYPKGSGNNILLAFESADECIEFAFILKHQQFFDPMVSAQPAPQLSLPGSICTSPHLFRLFVAYIPNPYTLISSFTSTYYEHSAAADESGAVGGLLRDSRGTGADYSRWSEHSPSDGECGRIES